MLNNMHLSMISDTDLSSASSGSYQLSEYYIKNLHRNDFASLEKFHKFLFPLVIIL